MGEEAAVSAPDLAVTRYDPRSLAIDVTCRTSGNVENVADQGLLILQVDINQPVFLCATYPPTYPSSDQQIGTGIRARSLPCLPR